MKVIIAAIFYSIFFLLVELISRKSKLSKELSRKIVHIFSGTSVAFLPFAMTLTEIIYLSLLFIPIMYFSKKINFFSSIHQVKRITYGEVYFPLGILLTAFLFPQRSIYMYGILIMAISDGLASLVGQKYGKKKYKIVNSYKSYVGSITFFVTAVLIGLLFTKSFLLVILLSGVLMIIEAVISGGLDNLILPIIGSGLLMYFLKFLN